MLKFLGNPAPGKGRRTPTVTDLVQTVSPLQHSAISSPCSSQTSPMAFPSVSSKFFSLVQTVLVLPIPSCPSSVCFSVTAVPGGPLRLLQSHPSSPVLPTFCFPVTACLPTFPASIFTSCARHSPLLCPISRTSPLQGSLSSQGTSAPRVVVSAEECWRGRGICSEATHGLVCAWCGYKPRYIQLLTLATWLLSKCEFQRDFQSRLLKQYFFFLLPLLMPC